MATIDTKEASQQTRLFLSPVCFNIEADFSGGGRRRVRLERENGKASVNGLPVKFVVFNRAKLTILMESGDSYAVTAKHNPPLPLRELCDFLEGQK